MAILAHHIEYDVDADVSVAEIVATMQANEFLLLQAAALLERCVVGLDVVKANVLVREITQRSPLKEYFAIAVVIAYQKELGEEVPALIERLTGVTMPEHYDGLVTVLVMLLAIYGISKAFEKLFPSQKPEQLSATYDRYVHVAGNYLNVPPDKLESCVKDIGEGKEKRKIEISARRFFGPLIGRPNRGLKSNGDLLLSPEAVREIPTEVQEAANEDEGKPETHSEMERNVRVIFHATDRDKSKSGWAGHVPKLFEERVRMILDKDIPAQRLFGKTQVVGDVLVVYERNNENEEFHPREFVLLSVNAGTKSGKPKKRTAVRRRRTG